MLWKSLAVWLCFGVVAVMIGAAREGMLVARIGELAAHQVGTLLVCLAIVGIVVATTSWLRLTSAQAARVGALWVALTVLFELGVFHYLAGVPWKHLLADYDLSRGRLWPLVLVTELASPWLAARAREGNGRY